jgi:hypothetical protein
MQLKVQKLPDGDGWRDMVRVPHKFRKDATGEHIARGHVVRIHANGQCGYVVVRGYDYKANEPHDGLIFVDSTWRGKLKLEVDESYEVTLERVDMARERSSHSDTGADQLDFVLSRNTRALTCHSSVCRLDQNATQASIQWIFGGSKPCWTSSIGGWPSLSVIQSCGCPVLVPAFCAGTGRGI